MGWKSKGFLKKNSWVDRIVMRDVAKRFVEYKHSKHGNDTCVILFCDNLSAHLDEQVKQFFSTGIFLMFSPTVYD